MSVLSSKEISDRLGKRIDDFQSLRITPLLDETFDHDAVDVRLGCYFRLPAVSTVPCIRPYFDGDAQGRTQHYPQLVHRPYRRNGGKQRTGERDPVDKSSLVLQPHHAVLASTLEYIKMPGDVSAEILTKSSWARVFISIASAPWVHPFYRGCLTLEITNSGNVPVILPVGKKIAHLVFMHLGEHDPITEDLVEGTYAGAIMPEPPSWR